MNKTEFIIELENRLKYIPKEDRDDAISYYNEYLSEMEIGPSDDITAKLGTPKEVAKEILNNVTTKAIEAQKETKSVKGSGKIVWLVILGIASLPVSLPLAIAALVVVIAVLITVFAVVLAFVAAAVAIFFAGIVALFGGFTIPGIANKLAISGFGALLLGLGVFATFGSIELFKLVIKLIGKIFNKNKARKGD